jgi:hypothetical protein
LLQSLKQFFKFIPAEHEQAFLEHVNGRAS